MKKILALLLSVLLVIQNAALADSRPFNLAPKSLCSYPEEENAFIKFVTSWLGNGGIDKFAKLPVSAAENLGTIHKENIDAPNNPASGQVFYRDGDFVLRAYNPQIVDLVFPIGDFDVLLEKEANKYLHFQVLKFKDESLTDAFINTIVFRFNEWHRNTKENGAHSQKMFLMNILDGAKPKIEELYTPEVFDRIFQRTIGAFFGESKDKKEQREAAFLFMFYEQFSCGEIYEYFTANYPSELKHVICKMETLDKTKGPDRLTSTDVWNFMREKGEAKEQTVTTSEQVARDLNHLFNNLIAMTAGGFLRRNFRHLGKYHTNERTIDIFDDFKKLIDTHEADTGRSIRKLQDGSINFTVDDVKKFLRELQEIHEKNLLEDAAKLDEIIKKVIAPDQQETLLNNSKIARDALRIVDNYINILNEEISLKDDITIEEVSIILSQLLDLQKSTTNAGKESDLFHPYVSWLGGLAPVSGSETSCRVKSAHDISFRVYLRGESFYPQPGAELETKKFADENIKARLKIRKFHPETRSFEEPFYTSMEYYGIGGMSYHDYDFKGVFVPKAAGTYYVTAEACVLGHNGEKFKNLLWRSSINPNTSDDNPSGDAIFVVEEECETTPAAPEPNLRYDVMQGVKEALPKFVNMLQTAGYTPGKEEKRKIGVFIDVDLGLGGASAVAEALVDLARTKDGLLKELLQNVVISFGEINETNLGEMEEKRKIKKEDLFIITRADANECLKKYEGTSIITKVDDKELEKKSYYPLLEIVLFTVARSKMLKFSREELAKFYSSIPNIAQMDEEMMMSPTITIKIGIPDATQVTANSSLYNEIAKYIESNA